MVRTAENYKKIIEKFIENELYNHEENKRALKELAQAENYEIPLITQIKAYRRLAQTVEVIEKVLGEDEDFRKIYEYIYVKRKSYIRTCVDLCFSSGTFYNKKRKLLRRIAEELGFAKIL